MENTVSKVRLTKNPFGRGYSLRTDKGKLLTPLFKLYEETVIGDFVKLQTDIGDFVYNKNQPKLLYEDYHKCQIVFVYKLTEEIYYLQAGDSPLQLYSFSGVRINRNDLEDVCPIGNDLIAAKEYGGKWGILDKDLNWKIYPTYDEIFEFRGDFAFAIIEDECKTDLMCINENGKLHVVRFDGNAVDYPHANLVCTSKNKKLGVCNTQGYKLLNFEYDGICFSGNHFILKKNDLYGLADISGKILFECKYYQIIKTEDGFDLVTRKIIDTTEHIIV